MDLIRFSIQRPVTISVGVLLILMAGLISLGAIPIQLTPNIDTTVISVVTHWEGASPGEIETEVVSRQEEKLKGIGNLQRMSSTCSLGEGQITLEFTLGTDRSEALRDASDRLREVTGYPLNMDEPTVRATNPADRDYIAWVVITCSEPGFDVRELYDFFDRNVKSELERVPGVAEVNVIGGLEREAQIQVDPLAMAARGIAYGKLIEAINAQNRSASAGQLVEGKRDIRVRSMGRYESPLQITETLLSDPGTPLVKVGDVARVHVGFKEPNRLVRSRGERVLAINAQRELGSNVIEVMRLFRQRLDQVVTTILPAEEKRLGLPVGSLKLEQVYDQTVYIHQALDMVRQNLWLGGGLATAVLLLFLWSVRSTLIIALAIPVSVIGTFAVMTLMGRNLNVISLAGLAFSVGMVVDNAIVVLENIDRHRRMGKPVRRAAEDATREVWGAILASTLTTVAVFLPVLILQEEAGQLFRDISLAICASVMLSLVVSMTVIPAAASRWLGDLQPAAGSTALSGSSRKGLEAAFSGAVSRLVYGLCGSVAARIAGTAGLTAASVGLSVWLMPPADYLPGGNRNLVFALLSPPSGYTLDQKEKIGIEIEKTIRPFWEAGQGKRPATDLPPVSAMDFASGTVHQIQVPPLSNFFFVAVGDRVFMGAISADPAQVAPVAALLNQSHASVPGLRGFAVQMPLFRTASQGSGGGLEVELSGQNLEEVTQAAQSLMQRLIPVFGRVMPSPADFAEPGEEVQFRILPAEAADLGLKQQEINLAVQVLGDGIILGDYLDANRTIDLKVLARHDEWSDPDRLENISIATPAQRVVPLGRVARADRVLAPQQIVRVEELPTVRFEIGLDGSIPLEEGQRKIEELVAEARAAGEIPPTIRHSVAGTAAKLGQVKEALFGKWEGWSWNSFYRLLTSRMFLALLVVFLLMAALFEHWVYPAVIMFSVPLGAVGGFLGLRLIHEMVPTQQMDVLTMLGFVILIGVVVNNAILIVHQALNLMAGRADVEITEGVQADELRMPRRAIAESVRSRVRPILMSMLTSVGGMLPLVLMPGAGSELYRGLGAVVVGGLIISTLFTLIVVPLLFSLLMDWMPKRAA